MLPLLQGLPDPLPLPIYPSLTSFSKNKNSMYNLPNQENVIKSYIKKENWNQIKAHRKLRRSVYFGQLLLYMKAVMEWVIYPVSLYWIKLIFSLSRGKLSYKQ